MALLSRKLVLSSLALSLSTAVYSLPVASTNPTRHESLPQFIKQIWETNASVQSDAALVDASRFHASGEDQPLYNPNLELNGDRTDTTSYTVGVNQSLDLSGKRHARAEVGQAGLAVAEAQLKTLCLEIGIKALKDLAQYDAHQKEVSLAKQKTDLLKEFVNQIAKKYKAGDISQVQLDEANMVLAEAISLQAEVEEKLSFSKQSLSALTSNQMVSFPQLPDKLPLQPEMKNSEFMLKGLPQLQLLDEEVQKAKAHVKVAIAQTHADPTVGMYGGKDDEGKALVGVNVSVPLFVANNYQAGTAQANHEWIALEKHRMDVYQAAVANLQGSYERYQITHQAWLSWQKTSEQSIHDGKTLLNKLWEAGELSTTDYLIQLKQMLDSQAAGIRLHGEAWNAWFDWLEASNSLDQWLAQQNTSSQGIQK